MAGRIRKQIAYSALGDLSKLSLKGKTVGDPLPFPLDVICVALTAAIESNPDAKNYLGFEWELRGKIYSALIQRKEGKTPADVAAAERALREKAEQEAAGLRAAIERAITHEPHDHWCEAVLHVKSDEHPQHELCDCYKVRLRAALEDFK